MKIICTTFWFYPTNLTTRCIIPRNCKFRTIFWWNQYRGIFNDFLWLNKRIWCCNFFDFFFGIRNDICFFVFGFIFGFGFVLFLFGLVIFEHFLFFDYFFIIRFRTVKHIDIFGFDNLFLGFNVP